ncbi:trypsin-like serine peptidase [Nonomuraea insulae]|uniref:Trypsin-like serine peptidase n=1 Tax=Nonomuraea insulae TaxID=1616787 RepID=A0ABW1D4F5_9ACTN
MKRILLPAGGAILATGLLAAGLATTAQADDTIANADLAKTQAQAEETVEFWTKSNNAALKGAVAFNPDALEVSKTSMGGGYSSDTKAGLTAPIGEEKKSTAKVQNVNLPKTIGKVFFEGRDSKLYWCSGTSIQSQYRNLVATAGHCVYDVVSNQEVVSRWVFVPGYYQGKTPWGLYVGKQAFTHYDFEVYEDYDRDYAFVTVYDALGGTLKEPKKVTRAEWKSYDGEKLEKKATEVSWKEYKAGKLNPETSEYYDRIDPKDPEGAGPNYPGAELVKDEVTRTEYLAAKTGKGQGRKYGAPEVEQVTYNEALAYIVGQGWEAAKPEVPATPTTPAVPAVPEKPAVPNAEFPGTVKLDRHGNSTITHFYVQQWQKPGSAKKFVRYDYYIVVSGLKSAGRLGDNVGGQGVAWNQPSGKYVRTFGYPQGSHPDGNKPYTGVTPKWCYGKTAHKALQVPARKVEEQQSFKCAVTSGYDGAPWLYKYSNAKRLGYVNGVTSLIADTDKNGRYDTITTPYFDGEAAAIYKAASVSWSGKLVK